VITEELDESMPPRFRLGPGIFASGTFMGCNLSMDVTNQGNRVLKTAAECYCSNCEQRGLAERDSDTYFHSPTGKSVIVT
jgi:hypothetical protein